MLDLKKSSKILVTCPKGMADSVSDEMKSLGYKINKEIFTGAETNGNIDDCMKLNLHMRTAHKVMYQLDRFSCRNADDLYNKIKNISWEDVIPKDSYISISSSVLNDTINDTRFPNMRTKDAICDRLSAKTGKRPDSGPSNHGIVIFLHWHGNRCMVFLDTSGEPLPKRGYRLNPHKAPMQETLSAACILKTGWDGSCDLINPMCGSGTLVCEAAFIGLNIAPGLLRKDFAFMKYIGFDDKKWQKMRAEARSAMKSEMKGQIYASDINPNAVSAARENIERAGLDDYIKLKVSDFRDLEIKKTPAVIIMNPEYGKRLGEEEKLASVYSDIGDFFKQKCKGCMGYIFTGNLGLAKKVGLRTNRKIPFFSAKIECRLLEYEMYEGTRKNKDKD